MIIQGSNNPLVIQFDTSIADMPSLIITLWEDKQDKCEQVSEMVKRWNKEDMTISNDTAICPLSEEETKNISTRYLILEAKGLDINGNTIFWDQYKLYIKARRDRIITLTQTH